VSLDADGAFTYVPAPDFFGSDGFIYAASDGLVDSPPVSVSIAVLPVNVAPVIAAIPDMLIAEGGAIDHGGSFSDANPGDSWTATAEYGDGSGPQPLDLAAEGGEPGTAFALHHTYGESGEYEATVQVVDQGGRIGTARFSVTVLNLPPAVEAGPDREAGEGVRVHVAASFSDPGTADTHTATIDWGDGTGARLLEVDELDGTGTARAAHAYADEGVYTVTIAVTDDEGATASDGFTVTVTNAAPFGAGAMGSASLPVTIQAVALQPDPVDPAKTALVVGGTNGNDEIKFITDKASGGVKLQINRVTLGPFVPTGRLVAYGLAGDDDIIVAAGIALPAELYGGPGQDTLKAGKGSAILVGGRGSISSWRGPQPICSSGARASTGWQGRATATS
jgi:hypothetical protein